MARKSKRTIGKSMATAPQDGTRIILDAELASDPPKNAFNGWIFGAWDKRQRRWELSPRVPGTHIDAVHAWLPATAAEMVDVKQPAGGDWAAAAQGMFVLGRYRRCPMSNELTKLPRSGGLRKPRRKLIALA